MRFPNAAKGLKKIFIAEVLSILAALLGICMLALMTAIRSVSVVGSGEAVSAGMQAAGIVIPFLVYRIGTVLLLLVGFFISIAGIIQASKDEASFRNALWAELLGLALSIAAAILQNSGSQAAGWLSAASTVVSLLVHLLVLDGVCRLAGALGKTEIMAMGSRCRIYLLCAMLLSAAGRAIMVLFPGDPDYVSIIGIADFLMEIGAYVLYLRVLAKAKSMQ